MQATQEVGSYMTTTISKQQFLNSENGMLLRKELLRMVKSIDYNTSYAHRRLDTNGSQFVEKHMTYMSIHPAMDHWQYILNLKLMTKIR
jgi:hypothetical protein